MSEFDEKLKGLDLKKKKKPIPKQEIVPVKEEMKKATVYFPKTLRGEIAKYCFDKDVFFKDFVIAAAMEKLEREK